MLNIKGQLNNRAYCIAGTSIVLCSLVAIGLVFEDDMLNEFIFSTGITKVEKAQKYL